MDERPAYSIGVVAQRTSIPADTIRAWERRYSVAVPRRTPGGHRLYSARDIETLRWLRDRVNEGMPISNAVALLQPPTTVVAVPATTIGRATADLAAELKAALIAFRADRADTVLSEAFALHGVERTCLDLLQRVLIDIGDDWHAGTVSVAQEHYASHFVGAKLGQLQTLHPTRADDPLVVTACLPTEQHELGLAMLALFLAWRGIRTVNLGADVPAPALVRTIGELRPRLLCLSATTLASAERGHDMVLAVRSLPDAPVIALGGAAFEQHPELRTRYPGLHLGADALLAAESARQLLRAGVPAAAGS